MFIKLTGMREGNNFDTNVEGTKYIMSGYEICININNIDTFSKYKDDNYTALFLKGGMGINIKESPEEILKLIKECEK